MDTNTKGHQQWFNFRVKNTRKNRKYIFYVMNFTKPGIKGGQGYRKNELNQRVCYKSQKSGRQEWQSIQKIEFLKTSVPRRKKDVVAGNADSDQDDEVAEQMDPTSGENT